MLFISHPSQKYYLLIKWNSKFNDKIKKIIKFGIFFDDIFRTEIIYNNDIRPNADNNIYLNDEKEFDNRVRYLITKPKNEGLIENIGSDKYSIWK